MRVRDLAQALNGTSSQFNVGWDGASGSVKITTNTAYKPDGSEGKTPFSGPRSYAKSGSGTLIDGKKASLVTLELRDDKGGGYTYYQLQDMGKALGFTVKWDDGRKLVVITTPQPAETAPAPAAGNAPDFTGTLLNGGTISLSECRGKKVLLNFWATWCGPCVREMPALQRLSEEFPDRLVVIAVDCGEARNTVDSFRRAKGYTVPIVLDDGTIADLFGGVNSIPYTVIIDENGDLVTTHTGAADADTMYRTYKSDLGL